MTRTTFDIPGLAPGRLLIGPHPDTANLRRSIATLARNGVTEVLSLLPFPDVVALGLGQQAALCADEGLIHHSFPIPDFGLPDRDALRSIVTQMDARLMVGATLFIHCRAGIGRSGILATALLIHRGQPADVAIDQVSTARGLPIPDTPEQANFIRSLAARVPRDA